MAGLRPTLLTAGQADDYYAGMAAFTSAMCLTGFFPVGVGVVALATCAAGYLANHSTIGSDTPYAGYVPQGGLTQPDYEQKLNQKFGRDAVLAYRHMLNEGNGLKDSYDALCRALADLSNDACDKPTDEESRIDQTNLKKLRKQYSSFGELPQKDYIWARTLGISPEDVMIELPVYYTGRNDRNTMPAHLRSDWTKVRDSITVDMLPPYLQEYWPAMYNNPLAYKDGDKEELVQAYPDQDEDFVTAYAVHNSKSSVTMFNHSSSKADPTKKTVGSAELLERMDLHWLTQVALKHIKPSDIGDTDMYHSAHGRLLKCVSMMAYIIGAKPVTEIPVRRIMYWSQDKDSPCRLYYIYGGDWYGDWQNEQDFRQHWRNAMKEFRMSERPDLLKEVNELYSYRMEPYHGDEQPGFREKGIFEKMYDLWDMGSKYCYIGPATEEEMVGKL